MDTNYCEPFLNSLFYSNKLLLLFHRRDATGTEMICDQTQCLPADREAHALAAPWAGSV